MLHLATNIRRRRYQYRPPKLVGLLLDEIRSATHVESPRGQLIPSPVSIPASYFTKAPTPWSSQTAIWLSQVTRSSQQDHILPIYNDPSPLFQFSPHPQNHYHTEEQTKANRIKLLIQSKSSQPDRLFNKEHPTCTSPPLPSRFSSQPCSPSPQPARSNSATPKAATATAAPKDPLATEPASSSAASKVPRPFLLTVVVPVRRQLPLHPPSPACPPPSLVTQIYVPC